MLGWLKGNGRWLALGALVLLNVVLITLLIVQQTTILAAPAEVATPSASPSGTAVASREPASSSHPASPRGSAPPSASPSPVRSDSPSPPASRSSTEARRLLAANSAKIAWRAEESDCDHQSRVEVTSDGGRTWRKTTPGIRGIVRLVAYGESSVFAVGADAECKPTYAWITSPDGSWRRDQSVIWDVWFRYPDDSDRVHAPGGRTFRPCGGDLVTLAGIGSYQAAVLCEDGRIRTIARGRAWRTVLSDSGGLAINADTERFLLARIRPDCDGIVLQQFDAQVAEPNDHGVCRKARADHQDQVGAASMGDVHWLWVGRDTAVW